MTASEINNNKGVLQKKLGTGFNAKSTASEVIKGIDLTGKIAVVTGGNTGIGLETTKVFAAAGAKIVKLHGRLARVYNSPSSNVITLKRTFSR